MLSFVEYQNLGGLANQEEFEKLVKKAESVLNAHIRHYYRNHDFETDAEWRKSAVKASIAFQVDYFHETQSTSYESLNNTPQTITLGRTTISQTSRFNAAGANEKKPMLCFDSVMALQGTGLLYRGVG